MDRDTRNLLANTTQAFRRGLEEEFALQLEGRFDVLRDGSIADAPGPQLDDSEKLTRRKIVEAIHHRRASGESEFESVDGFLRETAFTFLNRLAALKMMEARGIVQECVSACDSHGFNARGFKEFGGLAPGLIELPDGGYRLYLECLFDEIGREVGILFDRTDPASLLWPRRAALLDALGRINDPKLAGIWSEDETIGWIYQYYNDPEERRKMRDVKQGGSAAPRNSREMAVRNQFFTPRYVVEFLTDNSLGRLWYEMTKGKTSLKDRCRYLIKRPMDVFLVTPTFEELAFEKSDWVAEVARSGNFSRLPENPLIEELARFALLIEGYELMEKIEQAPAPGDPRDATSRFIDRVCNPQLEASERGPRPWQGTALELWCALFIIQRLIWREGWLNGGAGKILEIHVATDDSATRDLWPVLRHALQHPPENLSKEEQLQQPVFIAHRPLKDPRQIRLIDPACGSMHFGLYAFDLLEIIYREWSESVPLSSSPTSPSPTSPLNIEGGTPLLPFLKPSEDIHKHRTHLPHWEQETVTYFLTWRLADSLPKAKLEAWKQERELWIAQNPQPWDEDTENDFHRRFSDKLDEWLDAGAGRCILRDPAVASIVATALRHFDGLRYLLDCFVVMPNHVHVLVRLAPDESLSKVLHSWKSFTAKEINRTLGSSGPVWQEDYFDRIIRNQRHLNACRCYIERNPVKARLREGSFVLQRSESVPLSPSPTSPSPSPSNIEGGTPSLHSRAHPRNLTERERPALGFSNLCSFDCEGETPSLLSIPKLILEHNIHGIDIDPRATQIAGLALWLRAQKAWQKQGLRPADCPAITRSNIVCAEPMPGEEDLLLRFVERSFPSSERPFFTKLLGEIFRTMRLAGEAGSLLKIEDEVSALVADVCAQWKKVGKREGDFFSQTELVNLDRRAILQQPVDTGTWSLEALLGIPAQFWEKAEEHIYDALRAFAESAESNYQRRLFADDAAHGFAFIDLCRQRYDVALMNPPFGDASLPSKPYLDETYGDTKGDVYKAFVECFQARLVPAGFLGIISSRTGFFLGQSEDWRTRVVLRLFRPIALADLGMGVLDAMVEVAAYVLRSLSASETRDLTHSIVPTLEAVVLDKQERFSLPKWQAARDGLKRHQAIAELEHLESEGFIQRCDGDVVRYSPNWKAARSGISAPKPVFPPLVCIRTLADDDKAQAIRCQISQPSPQSTFICDPASFKEVPGSPFAYWTSASIRMLFGQFEQFERADRVARLGMNTADNFRFLRSFWEISPIERKDTWVPFVKGGAYARFYADVPLLVNWKAQGIEMKAWIETRPGCSHWSRRIASAEYYHRPGLTWPLRTSSFSPQAMPSGCIFSVRGYAIIAQPEDLPSLLAFCASSAFDYLFKIMLGRFGFPEFVVGILQKIPMPRLTIDTKRQLNFLSSIPWKTKRSIDTANLTSNAFFLPALLTSTESKLVDRTDTWSRNVRRSNETISNIQSEIDGIAFDLYDLDDDDRAVAKAALATETETETETETATDDAEEEIEEEKDAATADSTMLTADLLAYAIGCAIGRWDLRFATGEKPAPPEPAPFDPLPICPPGMLQNADGLPATPVDVPAEYPLRISWPGILVDDKGHDEDIETRVREVLGVVWSESVPLSSSYSFSSGRVEEGRAGRPLSPEETRAGRPCSDSIIHEACEILGVKTLREFFRKPPAFFAVHLTSHSKGSRQAPIYWPLSSPNGLYTLWLYYPRLTADTLFTALRDFLEPKLQYEEGRAFRIRQDAGPTPAPSQRAEIAEADELVDDLRALRDELKRVAPLFKPDLNDGVILNHAPLWRMIGLPKWRKDCQATWEKLAAGDYDWAHLALHLWPERVIPKCATDRSLAIAHGLEDFFWEEIPRDELPNNQRGRGAKKRSKASEAILEAEEETPTVENEDSTQGTGKWRKKKVSTEELQQLIATHTSHAVKAALEALATAPTSGGSKKARKAHN